jgi:MFS family permease
MTLAAPPRSLLSPWSFGLIFCCHFILAIGNTGLVSVLPAIGRSIGIPDALVAATFSLSGLLLAICSPMWAKISDQRGRRPLIILGMIGYTVSMTMCGLVVTAGLHHLAPWFVIVPFLLCARAIFGTFGSAIGPAGQAFIAERTPRGERTKVISSLAGAQGLGMVIGPLLAPLFVLPLIGLSGPLFGFALIAGCMTMLVFRFLKEGPKLETEEGGTPAVKVNGKLQKPWRDPRISPFLIYALTIGVAQGSLTQIFAFLVIDTVHGTPAQAQGQIAVAMMFGAVAGLSGQWGLIRIFNMTPRDLMRWGAGAALVGHLMIIASSQYWFIVAGYAIACLGFAFARPGFTAGLSLSVSLGEQARVAGILAMFAGLNLVTPFFVLLYQFQGKLPFIFHALSLSAILIYCFRQPLLRSSGVRRAHQEVSEKA